MAIAALRRRRRCCGRARSPQQLLLLRCGVGVLGRLILKNHVKLILCGLIHLQEGWKAGLLCAVRSRLLCKAQCRELPTQAGCTLCMNLSTQSSCAACGVRAGET